MNFASLVQQATASTNAQDWAGYQAKTMGAHTDTMLDLLRAELIDLTGAPVSPNMSAVDLHKAVIRAKNPIPQVETDTKTVVKPSKPQGIGKTIVECLKGGMTPKDTLNFIQTNFEGTATSMACVYWYKSKINTGAI